MDTVVPLNVKEVPLLMLSQIAYTVELTPEVVPWTTSVTTRLPVDTSKTRELYY